MQVLKGNSSKWINDTFPALQPFAWQEGYGAFSVGISQAPATRAYIARQREHHGRTTFEEEYVRILEKHGIAYDRRYVFDGEVEA